MSMKWAVPIVDMKQTGRQREKRCSREEKRERSNQLKCCPECKCVFKKADFTYKKLRNNAEEEYYEPGTMPTIYLERKLCLNCKEKVATVI